MGNGEVSWTIVATALNALGELRDISDTHIDEIVSSWKKDWRTDDMSISFPLSKASSFVQITGRNGLIGPAFAAGEILA